MKTTTTPGSKLTPALAEEIASEFADTIARHSQDCGIPVKELALMIFRAGVAQLEGDGITVRPKSEETAKRFAGAYIPEDDHSDLAAIAASEHRTLADHVRKLYAEEIERRGDLLANIARKGGKKP